MDAQKLTHEYRLSQWAPIIHACRNSGMTVKAWCQENSINEKQFFYWQRRVREEISSLSSELPVAMQNTAFVPLKVSDNRTDKYFSPVMVLSIGNSRLELSNQTSPELLASILKVLGHV
ncbi:IS66 family insertion sequence element accessory protein TnpA [Ruminiclostridium cellobioparum]|uniref:Transposase n=1 Tax=Ruminiclostridium cellobioparum subsp. termitidis CT1112 TaxID=1195236 RepID=S0FL24_RUMCE|nr:hypothetical protein [Ruminiclostridium cellobioparum]EMS69213.1 Transposase [Ruminiclostridium cellobioparum subsp. termitidis CT1112]